jgi:hypothetical protein
MQSSSAKAILAIPPTLEGPKRDLIASGSLYITNARVRCDSINSPQSHSTSPSHDCVNFTGDLCCGNVSLRHEERTV